MGIEDDAGLVTNCFAQPLYPRDRRTEVAAAIVDTL